MTGNGMFDGNRILPDDDLLDQEFHDPLTIADVKGFSGGAQARQKRRQGLGKAQVRGAIRRLGIQCLKLGVNRLFALSQCRHACTQFIEG